MDKEAARQMHEQIYAVQQLFALRVRRLELQPYWSFSLNDQFVGHPAPGLALNAPPGTVTSFSAPARDLSISSPLREGQPGTLTIQGEVGDFAWVIVSLGAAYQPLAPKQGVLLLDSSVLLLPVAVGVITSPSGTLTVPFVTPQLNPVLKGLTVPMQLAVQAGGVTTLESVTLLGWLDSTL